MTTNLYLDIYLDMNESNGRVWTWDSFVDMQSHDKLGNIFRHCIILTNHEHTAPFWSRQTFNWLGMNHFGFYSIQLHLNKFNHWKLFFKFIYNQRNNKFDMNESRCSELKYCTKIREIFFEVSFCCLYCTKMWKLPKKGYLMNRNHFTISTMHLFESPKLYNLYVIYKCILISDLVHGAGFVSLFLLVAIFHM